MTTVDSSVDALAAQLEERLLSDQPSRVVVVGRPLGVHRWQARVSADGPCVQCFDTLSQCLDVMPPESVSTQLETREAAQGPCVALMQFDHLGELSNTVAVQTELGRAVRRFPKRLVVSIDSIEPDDALLFSFGFRKLQLEHQESIRLFEYCLSDYKQSPDWLNARYWSNPERFALDNDSDDDSEDGYDEDE